DPAVRAIFSSSTEPPKIRSTAIPITAAGYVGAIGTPARNPRYAFRAPRITAMERPRRGARAVKSPFGAVAGEKGWNSGAGVLTVVGSLMTFAHDDSTRSSSDRLSERKTYHQTMVKE